ncbi:MAG: SpoIIIAH-like family protein [Eubacteriales bacterium]|nr:SpoIIIAH-like family protein [Eubacteriales bacterium]
MKKIKKNQIIITALAIMIAIAGYINYTGSLSNLISVRKKDNVENTQNTQAAAVDGNELYSSDVDPDASEITDPGGVILTSGTVSSSLISEAKLNREQIRAKNKENLMAVINDAALSESAKTDAVTSLAAITSASEKEIAAELLLEAKGFSDVVVSCVDGTCDVVVNKTSINDTQKAQIEDIIKRKTGVTVDKITINVCNNQNN